MGKGSKTTSTTNNYDPQSSRRMAAVAERQQEISEQQYKFYQEAFEPYIAQAMDFASAILPTQAQYNKSVLESSQRLLGLREDVQKRVLQEQARDVEVNRTLRDAAREEQLREIQRSSLAADKFYDTALQGVDVQQRLNEATADVTQGFTQAQAMTQRAAARAGISPRAVDITGGGLQTAQALAGARTLARRTAQQESFQMLGAAMGARGRGVAAVPGVGGGQAIPFTGATQTAGERMGITSPLQSAAQFGAMATQGYGTLAGRPISQTTKTSGGGGGAFGSIVGGLFQAGTTLGAAALM